MSKKNGEHVSQESTIVWEKSSHGSKQHESRHPKSRHEAAKYQESKQQESNVIPFRQKGNITKQESTYTEWNILTQSEEPVKIKIMSSGFGQTYQNGKLYCAA